MATTIEKYTTSQKVIASFIFLFTSIVIALVATSIIYAINTYWYQESKANYNKKISARIYESIKNVRANEPEEYFTKLKELLKRKKEKISVRLISKQYNKEYYYQTRNMSEFSNSNYFVDERISKINIAKQPFYIEYIYKKRIGNTLLYDVFDAATFSLRFSETTRKKFNLYQKSYVFYSYFIVILIGIYLASFIYSNMKKKLYLQQKELTDLLIRYQEERLKKVKINAVTDIPRIEKTQIDKIKKVNDKEHIKELKESIIHAKSSIYILSGWISTKVLDDYTMYILEEAIKRKVNVYIGFGYGMKGGECNSLNVLKKEQYNALLNLVRLKNKYNQDINSGSLYLGLFPTHQKILLKDDDFVICGSNNWLSNVFFNNRETSLKVFSKEIVKTEKSRIESLIQQYSINECM